MRGAGMGGWKSSGFGTRHGVEGIRKYALAQSSLVARFGLKRELFMFPYSKRSAGLVGAALKLFYGRRRR